VKKQTVNPLIGCGFYGFWDSPAATEVLSYIDITTAHNGYLEMYIDGGAVGVVFLGIMLAIGFRGMITRLLRGKFWGRISLMFFIIALGYNWSESNYFRLEPLWFTLLLVIIEYPQRSARRVKLVKPQTQLIEKAASLEFATKHLNGDARPQVGYGAPGV